MKYNFTDLEEKRDFYELYLSKAQGIFTILNELKQGFPITFNSFLDLMIGLRGLYNEVHFYLCNNTNSRTDNFYQIHENLLINLTALDDSTKVFNYLYNSRSQSVIKYNIADIDIEKYVKTLFFAIIQADIDNISEEINKNTINYNSAFKKREKNNEIILGFDRTLEILQDKDIQELEGLNIAIQCLLETKIKLEEENNSYLNDCLELGKKNTILAKQSSCLLQILKETGILKEELYSIVYK